MADATWVLTPVKAFAHAKGRLSTVLDPPHRERLARWMAQRVIGAAAPLPVAVCCDHEGVRAWAEAAGAEVVWTPGLGLNGAVRAGVDAVCGRGATRVVICHADLPFIGPLTEATDGLGRDDALIVPDRHDDGTNVMVLPAGPALSTFSFAFGPGSFDAHRAAATAAGWSVSVRRAAPMGWDIDRPDDLHPPASVGRLPEWVYAAAANEPVEPTEERGQRPHG